MAMRRAPTWGSRSSRSRTSANSLRLATPVMSAGLAAQPKPARILFSPDSAVVVRGGRGMPALPRWSAMRELMPPEWETTATPSAVGGGA